MIECLKNYERVRDIVHEVVTKPSAGKRNAKRQNGCLRRLYKQLRKEKLKTRRKRKIYPLDYRVPKNSKGK